jgi:hypothetical protein
VSFGAPERGKGDRRFEREGDAEPRRIRRCTAAAPAGSGEEIEQPGGFFLGEKREGRERGVGAL